MNEAPQFFIDVVPITEENSVGVMRRADPFYRELELIDPGRKFQDFGSYVSEGAEAVFLVSANTRYPVDMGVSIQRLKVISYQGENIRALARYLRVIKKEHQDLELGPVLTEDAIQRHHPKIITARTFNPYIFRVEEKSPYIGEHAITPIHDDEEASQPMLYTPYKRGLLVAIFGEDSTEVGESDPETGLCKNVYPPRNEGVFDLIDASPRVLEIYGRMRWLGFNLRRGDGIRYVAEVKPPTGVEDNRFPYYYAQPELSDIVSIQ